MASVRCQSDLIGSWIIEQRQPCLGLIRRQHYNGQFRYGDHKTVQDGHESWNPLYNPSSRLCRLTEQHRQRVVTNRQQIPPMTRIFRCSHSPCLNVKHMVSSNDNI